MYRTRPLKIKMMQKSIYGSWFSEIDLRNLPHLRLSLMRQYLVAISSSLLLQKAVAGCGRAPIPPL